MPSLHTYCSNCDHADVWGSGRSMFHANPSLLGIVLRKQETLRKKCFKKGCKCKKPAYE